jgi:hypothetical protein
MTGTAVIDGDLLSYRAAAANEKRFVIAQNKETLKEHRFDTATAFKEWVKACDLEATDFILTPGQDADEIAFAFKTMKQMIENITKEAGCDNYHIVVSGEDNFRLDLPLPTRYKDSRKDSMRPIQLSDCKQYLIHFQNAEVSAGVEADDVLVGYMYQGYKDGERVVQCSIDKDAKHGPGWLYDWTTMQEAELIEGYGALTCTLKETARKKANGDPVVEKVIKGKGRAFLYYQIVFGDPVDAYKPCELAKAKFGEVGAYELLKGATNDKEALEAIVRQYKVWYPEPVTYRCWKGELHTKNWLEIMQMYADCAFMRRWEGDRLDIAALLIKQGVLY